MMNTFYFACWFAILGDQIIFLKAIPFTGTASSIQQAGDHEFEFIVSISKKNYRNLLDDEVNHVCGGSLITTMHVLTAAHCKCLERCKLKDYTVKVGHDLRNWEANYSVASWKTYKKFWCPLVKRGYQSNDISVIKLSEDIHTKITREIVLPKLNYLSIDQLYHKTAVTAGWGKGNTFQHPRHMQKVEMITISMRECQQYIDEAPKVKIMRGQFRRRYILENDILCSNGNRRPGMIPYAILGDGDSGSPLVIGRNEIIGINYATIPDEGPDSMRYEQNLHIALLPYRKFITNQITPKCFW